ncbi:hypothetical protein bcgnr5406_22030 [Bacillus cereus]|uniref:Uncharacterized protein n=1 Tax=Bacillus cereus TaxID=1396 RepID=A0A164P3T5_BACCE|nr:hypothetical protein B4088_2609 [Bacillus cereus]
MLRGGFAFEIDGLFLQNNLSIYKEKKYNMRKYICGLGNRYYVINENET